VEKLLAAALHPRLALVRRPLLFVASSCLLVLTQRTLDRGSLQATRRRFMRPWGRSAHAAPPRILDEIDAAVASACAWLPLPMSCLPRSITAYALANALGAQPVHHVGVRARPYYGHAWTQVGARTIGDDLGVTGRAGLRVVKRFPAGVAGEVR
jgi:hypothetical protein